MDGNVRNDSQLNHRLKRMTRIGFSVAAMVGLLGAAWSCKSPSSQGKVKDINLSPRDVLEPESIVWKTSDNNVHIGLCPKGPADRTCPGLNDSVKPLPLDDYKTRVIATLLNARPGTVNEIGQVYSELSVLKNKINRLKVLLNSPSSSATEKANFTAQLATYSTKVDELSKLTDSEQKILDNILGNLDAGKNVTFDEGEDSYVASVVPFSLGVNRVSTMPLVPPGSINNKIDKDKLVKAWLEVADMFYGPKPIYTVGTGVTIAEEPLSTCLSACPTYFSDLTCHFYCWHPSYKPVTPNIRGCFTSIARDQLVLKPNGAPLNLYPEVFDYCMFQDFDQNLGKIPAYDAQLIAQRKASNTRADRVGLLKYMSPEQEDAFKYVIFNWYNPFAFDPAEEKAVIDAFYAKHPEAARFAPKQVPKQTRTFHDRFPQIVGWMQFMYASGGLGPIVNAPTKEPTIGTSVSCKNGGVLVDGFCWWQAADGASCDETCSKIGMATSPATVEYAGSKGTDVACGKVAGSFGTENKLSGPSLAKSCDSEGCAKCSAGSSCSPDFGVSQSYRCIAKETTTSFKKAGTKPFCACN
jgi:hypothetical protein